MKQFILFLWTGLALFAGAAWAEPIVVVANVPGSVTIEELRTIYFQNGGRLSDGKVVAPLDYKEDNAEREQFYQRAFGRTKTQMKAYWAQRIFTGKGNPPQSVENPKEAANLLNSKSEPMVAYMYESEAGKGLHVILRIP